MMNSVGRQISNRGLTVQNLLIRLQSTTSNVISNSSSAENEIPIKIDCSSETEIPKKIKNSSTIEIPRKIERSPTDILRALERTIKRDPTAPRYKFHDDPYLIPMSNVAKRTFALSQESGRKAAMWIRQEHSDLFQHRVADPIIESFLPKAQYTDKKDVNEDILKNVIAMGHIDDALTIYELLNEDVSIDTKQSLLELLCYYNNEKPLSEDLLEENWLKKVDRNLTWQNNPKTVALFEFLKNQDIETATAAYNAMICGTAKYNKIDTAWTLYKETISKQIPLHLTTYNYLISIITGIKDGPEDRYNLLLELFKEMKSKGLQPNTSTLNNGLKVTTMINHTSLKKDLCRLLFKEFQRIGVKPSLASYSYALTIFYRREDLKCDILTEILDEIEGKEFDIYETADTNFFITAMAVAANALESPVHGDRIHKILLTGKNYDFLNDGQKESIYYRHFFNLQVKNRPIEEFMNSYYDIMVPNIYIPEPSVMDAILNAIEISDPKVGASLLPRLWSNMVSFGFLERKNLVTKIINLMKCHCKPAADSPLNKNFGDAAWSVWEYVSAERTHRLQTINWDGHMLADIAVLLSRADEFEKCIEIISYLYHEQSSIIEIPEVTSLEELLEACIMHGHSESAVNLVHYCSDSGIENVSTMAYKVWRNLPLSEWQENRLKSLADPDVFTIPTKNIQ